MASTDRIRTHPRLLRSLSFGDDDYDDCINEVAPRCWVKNLNRPPTQTRGRSERAVAGRDDPAREVPEAHRVSDFVILPAWLAANEENIFNRWFITGAAMPDGTILSAAEATAVRLGVAEMRRQIERIRRDRADGSLTRVVRM